MSIDTHCKADFKTARHSATELLLKQNLDSLFIDVINFDIDIPIVIDSIQNYSIITKRPISDFICDGFNGCLVLKYNRCNVILYDETETNIARRNWGIAHELGHLYLGHETDGRIQEQEANVFAGQLIVPEAVLYSILKYKGSIKAKDLINNFNVSRECAENRLESFNKRLNFIDMNSNLNRRLSEKFRPCIEQCFYEHKLKYIKNVE